MNPQLPEALGTLASLLDSYGYAAIGALVLIEDFGMPVPGEAILVTAAVYAGAGQLNIVAVALIALIAAVLGDNIGYAIGRFGGRGLVLRWGTYIFVTAERLAAAEGFFRRHGGKVVTFARFVEGLRQLNGIVAGLTKMSWRRFLLFNALGAVLWVALWATVGDLAGDQFTALYNQFRRYEGYLGIAAVLVLIGLLSRRLWRRSS
jgi:membrane protein DedA with SNARE-associated domain